MLIAPLWASKTAEGATLADGESLVIGPFSSYWGRLEGHIYANKALDVDVLRGARSALAGPWPWKESFTTGGTASEGNGDRFDHNMWEYGLIRVTNNSGSDCTVFEVAAAVHPRT